MPSVRVWRCGSKSPAGSAHVRHGVARGVAGELEPRKLLHRIAAPGTYCHCGRVGGRPFEVRAAEPDHASANPPPCSANSPDDSNNERERRRVMLSTIAGRSAPLSSAPTTADLKR